jgi:hypothetical protein
MKGGKNNYPFSFFITILSQNAKKSTLYTLHSKKINGKKTEKRLPPKE